MINILYFFNLNIGQLDDLDLVDRDGESLFYIFSILLVIQIIPKEYILMVFCLRIILILLNPEQSLFV